MHPLPMMLWIKGVMNALSTASTVNLFSSKLAVVSPISWYTALLVHRGHNPYETSPLDIETLWNEKIEFTTNTIKKPGGPALRAAAIHLNLKINPLE